ncbi:MAG: MFS transporter [Phascolarctobacterium sp.]|nr:MFS transporter [Phascolarctobacterium sp.]
MSKNSFAVLAIVLGHLVTDLQAGALPIALPFLKEIFSLNYTQMAIIVLVQNVMTSVIQPLFGYITDKKSLPQFLSWTAALGGAGFALVGYSSSYGVLLAAVTFISLASATYHPQASKTCNLLSDSTNKARNMGFFSVGGNGGMAVGSLMMTYLAVREGGLHNCIYFIIPGVLVFVLLEYAMPEFKRVNFAYNKMNEQKHNASVLGLSYINVVLMLLYIFLRSTAYSSIHTYLPVYFMKFRSFDTITASNLVTIFLLSGVVGTLFGAVLSDKVGPRKIIVGSILLSALPIGFLPHATTPWASMLAVSLTGFFIISSFATTVVVVQNMMPNNVGMASGLTIGFSVGMSGFGVTVLGYLADTFGLPNVLESIAILPVVAALVATRIPIPEKL